MALHMKTIVVACLLFTMFGCQANPTNHKESSVNPQVVLRTSLGEITLELYPEKAPITVENFLTYVDEKHYDNTIFHRVIKGFMIQGGGMTANMEPKATHSPIQNEANNGLLNTRGSIAMARTSDIHSASSQFFINVADNAFLNFRAPTASGYGYCVFGKVISGMDVVEAIEKVKTGSKNGHGDVPLTAVTILEAYRKPKKS